MFNAKIGTFDRITIRTPLTGKETTTTTGV
jgi:hypothetical protein